MPEFDVRYYCNVCGAGQTETVDIPPAPKMIQREVTCEKCGDKTHLILTSCPNCGRTFKLFVSDLDFVGEIQQLSNTYVRLIAQIRDSLADFVKEFSVPVPRRWSVRLSCSCGHDYDAEIPLRQI